MISVVLIRTYYCDPPLRLAEKNNRLHKLAQEPFDARTIIYNAMQQNAITITRCVTPIWNMHAENASRGPLGNEKRRKRKKKN
jgi:hypothetical protein